MSLRNGLAMLPPAYEQTRASHVEVVGLTNFGCPCKLLICLLPKARAGASPKGRREHSVLVRCEDSQPAGISIMAAQARAPSLLM